MKFLQLIPVMAVSAFVIVGCSSDADVTQPVSAADQEQSKLFAAPAGASKVAGHYVIVFNDNRVAATAVPGEVNRLRSAHALGVEHIYETAIRGFSASVPPGILKKLLEDDNIQRVEEDYEISVVPVESKGRKPGPTPPPSSSRISPQITPWGVAATGRKSGIGKRAWIIDSGIDPNHPDLNVSATLSKNFVLGRKLTSASWADANGHGTHVAGTVGAKDDGYDVVGVAPGATVIAVRVLDQRGSGQYSWVIAGVNYVAANGVAGDVANMSLGGPVYSALDNAVINAANSKGIYFALAAGNSNSDCTFESPARAGLNQAYVWTVSAHDVGGNFAWFSSFGPPVDICSPGVDVVSTKLGGGVVSYNGTSMASPHVAGILLVGTMGSNGLVTGDPDGDPDDMARLVP